MIPVIALVGRPNVGKSTLFNQLTRSRDALVADHPGLTRDRQYGEGRLGDRPYLVIDTGGLGEETHAVDSHMASQAQSAIDEADWVIFLVDGRAGITPGDRHIAKQLRTSAKQVTLCVNKTDGLDADVVSAEFYELGFSHLLPISASHGRGVRSLIESILPNFQEAESDTPPDGIKVAIVGRPNVGKSTLVNRMLGQERVITFDMPGTTRDSIFIPMEHDGEQYILIDTAGVRRRARVQGVVEKFSVIKTLKAIEQADVVIAMLDAKQVVSEQDMHILGFVLDAGRSLILAVNKWDNLSADERTAFKNSLDRRLSFVDFADHMFISALHGTNVGHLFAAIKRAHASAYCDLNTSRLSGLLETAIETHQPPLISGRRIKLRYAHPGGNNPPTIVIHGNQTKRLPGSYKRYLMNYFRQALKLVGTPIRLIFHSSENPYASRKPKRR